MIDLQSISKIDLPFHRDIYRHPFWWREDHSLIENRSPPHLKKTKVLI